MTYCARRMVGRRFNPGRSVDYGSRIGGWNTDYKPVTEYRFGGYIAICSLGPVQCFYRRGGLYLSYSHTLLQSIYRRLLTPFPPAHVRARANQRTGRTHAPIKQIQALSTCNLVRGHRTVRMNQWSDLHRRVRGPADRYYRVAQTEYPNRKQNFATMKKANEPGTSTTAYGPRFIQQGREPIGPEKGGLSTDGDGSGRGAPHISGAEAP